MKKFLGVIFLVLSLALFGLFLKFKYGVNEVLEVITPTKLAIDLNNNKIVDSNEIICIPEIESFTKNFDEDFYKKYAAKLNFSKIDFINMGYLADEYATKILLHQQVNYKKTGHTTSECDFVSIKIGNVKYSKLLANSGFGIINGEIGNPLKFKEKFEISKKLNLVVYNHKSNIYHKLTCEYGNMAHDKILIPFNQLPIPARPCNFCFNNKNNTKKSEKNSSNITYPIANIPVPPTVYNDSHIEFYLMDYAHKLKPDKNCESKACRAVVNNINSASESIDLAIYGYEEIPTITYALKNAKSRGVEIRFVFDEATKPKNTYYKSNNVICEIADSYKSDVLSKEADHLMHNKFMIIDKKKVLTGSMNYSKTGSSGFDANDLIVIKSTDVAQVYQLEFEQMLNGIFHNSKQKIDANRSYNIGNTQLEIYFSPKDKTTNSIINRIKSAKEYIYIPTFLITDKNITNELISALNRGVDIKIIMDANSTSTLHTKYEDLRKRGIQLKFEIFAGKMHTKTMIIDNEYVIMGSMNFSNSGNKYNDENTVIIENSELAKFYKNYFKYLWDIIPDKYLKLNPSAESKESIGSCFDGVDNNFNGVIDKDEKLCK